MFKRVSPQGGNALCAHFFEPLRTKSGAKVLIFGGLEMIGCC